MKTDTREQYFSRVYNGTWTLFVLNFIFGMIFGFEKNILL